MATIRESLKKLVEVAKPVPGDEQEFVAKHGMQVLDFQGRILYQQSHHTITF